MVIWKYIISGPQFDTMAPAGSKALSVAVQYDKPVLWMLVNPGDPYVTYRITAVPTGKDFPGGLIGDFVGTVMLQDNLVFHIFVNEGSN